MRPSAAIAAARSSLDLYSCRISHRISTAVWPMAPRASIADCWASGSPSRTISVSAGTACCAFTPACASAFAAWIRSECVPCSTTLTSALIAWPVLTSSCASTRSTIRRSSGLPPCSFPVRFGTAGGPIRTSAVSAVSRVRTSASIIAARITSVAPAAPPPAPHAVCQRGQPP